ncbi:glycoside hydrolase family 76 protein [Christiangramia sediminicola]|uniref:Glycoside hydrolase family 76 protein n=1 Tax=Christiangramia sediminicola TaxID=3073267 RepID=A0ABU1EKX8_9FLAO|nr:glycoside hydrolase family 76 protein [Christiangramia sp. SM2212]MDR5589032.1 glycoside hydrolase family 76 protein [Christiangramia sp. SM2212]
MINRFKYFTVLTLMGFFALTSCSNDDWEPLNPPQGNNGEEPVAFEYTWAATADSLQESLQNNYLGFNGTYVQDNAGSSRFNYWPNAHVLHVLVDAYHRTGEDIYKQRALSLLRGIEIENGGDYNNVFNDDMLWLGNASMRAYNATNEEEYKEVAEYLWEIIKMSWSDDVFGGGITWKQDTPFQKNAVSNGPAAVLAMRLYEVDNDQDDLEWAKKIYEWQKNNLVDPQTGLVWDNISLQDGEVVTNTDWVFTYNVGTWIGAGLKLYNATGETQYLNDAVKTAKSTMNSPRLTTNGVLRDEGQGDGGLFKGILVRYFTQLIMEPDISESDRQDFIDFLEYNAKTFYDNGLSRPGMFASPNWAQAPGNTTDLTTQLSGMMLIEAAALLKEEGYIE